MNKTQLVIALFFCTIITAHAGNRETLLVHQPAIHGERIAFVYAEDIWTANIDGTDIQRLTTAAGAENHPRFSPCGKWISFDGEYDGNRDVYVIPAVGGIPKRLTWHPGPDRVVGFTPDSRVLFRSGREDHSRRHTQLYSVGVEDGHVERIPVPNAFKAAISPDGTQIAYNPLSEAFRQWKHYRGGTNSVIWIYDFNTKTVERVPQPEGRCNDIDPMWIGGKLFFLSDRDNEFNLYVYDPSLKNVTMITNYEDFPIIEAVSDGSRIIYERKGGLYVFCPSSRESSRIVLSFAADVQEIRPRFVSGSRYIRQAHISPSGARAVVNFRGEIITLPAEKGDPRNLTLSPAAHEQSPAWSPDGKHIAWFSDSSGEYALEIYNNETGQSRTWAIDGAGFYANIRWSPDSKKLTFADNGRCLYWFNTETGRMTKIHQEQVYRPGVFGEITGEWSPDSKWIAFASHAMTYFSRIFLYSIDTGQSIPVTDGLSDVSGPVFDKNGKFLYFFASTDAGPVKHWFAQSSHDMDMTRSIYLLSLDKTTPNPLTKQNDEESVSSDKNKKEEIPNIKIDFEGMENRIIDLPVPRGKYGSLSAGESGILFFMKEENNNASLHKFDLDKRESKEILTGINEYVISADNKNLLYRKGAESFITKISDKIEPGKGKLNADAVQVRIDPAKEWRQIFDEVWACKP
jgi:tricorn protease